MHKVIRIDDSQRTPVRPLVETIRLVNSEINAQNLDVHLMVLKPGGSTNYHHHTKSESVWIVLQGEAEAIIEGEKHKLERNCVVFVPPNVSHEFKAVGKEEYKFIEIFSPPSADHVASRNSS